MTRCIYIFLFLFLFVACKVRRQSTVHRQEKIQTEQTVLDSLSGRLISDISAKRKIRARLSTFAPPDSLGRQAIRAVLEIDMGEEESRKDSISMQSASFLKEAASSEAVTLRETEMNVSLFPVWKIAWILFSVATIILFIRYFRHGPNSP